MRSPRFLSSSVLPVIVLLAAVASTLGAEEPAQKDGERAPSAIGNRERWDRLPPEKRREIQRIFDRIEVP